MKYKKYNGIMIIFVSLCMHYICMYAMEINHNHTPNKDLQSLLNLHPGCIVPIQQMALFLRTKKPQMFYVVATGNKDMPYIVEPHNRRTQNRFVHEHKWMQNDETYNDFERTFLEMIRAYERIYDTVTIVKSELSWNISVECNTEKNDELEKTVCEQYDLFNEFLYQIKKNKDLSDKKIASFFLSYSALTVKLNFYKNGFTTSQDFRGSGSQNTAMIEKKEKDFIAFLHKSTNQEIVLYRDKKSNTFSCNALKQWKTDQRPKNDLKIKNLISYLKKEKKYHIPIRQLIALLSLSKKNILCIHLVPTEIRDMPYVVEHLNKYTRFRHEEKNKERGADLSLNKKIILEYIRAYKHFYDDITVSMDQGQRIEVTYNETWYEHAAQKYYVIIQTLLKFMQQDSPSIKTPCLFQLKYEWDKGEYSLTEDKNMLHNGILLYVDPLTSDEEAIYAKEVLEENTAIEYLKDPSIISIQMKKNEQHEWNNSYIKSNKENNGYIKTYVTKQRVAATIAGVCFLIMLCQWYIRLQWA